MVLGQLHIDVGKKMYLTPILHDNKNQLELDSTNVNLKVSEIKLLEGHIETIFKTWCKQQQQKLTHKGISHQR